jgi:hypothetical protein
MTSDGTYTFVATQTTHHVMALASAGADGTYIEFSSVRIREVAALPVDGTVADIELTVNADSISLSVDGSAPASSGAVTMPTLSSLTTHKLGSDATPANWANGALAYIGVSN